MSSGFSSKPNSSCILKVDLLHTIECVIVDLPELDRGVLTESAKLLIYS